MSFDIQCAYEKSPRPLHPVDRPLESISIRPSAERDFVDGDGRGYSGHFDGNDVVFNDGETDYIGRWLQGTSATKIRHTKLLPEGFCFTFMDHGRTPQRLHAVWEFDAPLEDVIDAWRLANFSLSRIDRHFNRNHPRASIHLRTRGAFITGADSSHVTIPSTQPEKHTHGEIHVGEFNPFTGFGIGFLLHQLRDFPLSKSCVSF